VAARQADDIRRVEHIADISTGSDSTDCAARSSTSRSHRSAFRAVSDNHASHSRVDSVCSGYRLHEVERLFLGTQSRKEDGDKRVYRHPQITTRLRARTCRGEILSPDGVRDDLDPRGGIAKSNERLDLGGGDAHGDLNEGCDPAHEQPLVRAEREQVVFGVFRSHMRGASASRKESAHEVRIDASGDHDVLRAAG
jgi:hypothetical protein